MVVGVVAFQGDVAEHMAVLSSLRVPSIEVRTQEDLAKVKALIIPGGESTVMAKFLEESGVGGEIVKRVRAERQKSKKAKGQKAQPLFVYGTCAGAIVLAKKVTGKNACRSLGLIDITVDRNAYGSQIDSFEATLTVKEIVKPLDVAFIRSPKITRVGKGVEILASYKGDPVLVRQGRVMAGTFHSEVRGEVRLHELFLSWMEK